jgi:hypothetical protein
MWFCLKLIPIWGMWASTSNQDGISITVGYLLCQRMSRSYRHQNHLSSPFPYFWSGSGQYWYKWNDSGGHDTFCPEQSRGVKKGDHFPQQNYH